MPSTPTPTVTLTPNALLATSTSVGSPAASPPARRTIVEADGFSVFYGAKSAVNAVTMDIRTGEVLAIIGPSGCGKSTFLRAVNRMNDLIPSCRVEGRLAFETQDVYAVNLDVVKLRRRIGMVFQKPNPFPKTIFDNVAYGPRLHGERRRTRLAEIVERSLERAGLFKEVKDRLEANALGLSGGVVRLHPNHEHRQYDENPYDVASRHRPLLRRMWYGDKRDGRASAVHVAR